METITNAQDRKVRVWVDYGRILIDEIERRFPSGYTHTGRIELDPDELRKILAWYDEQHAIKEATNAH